MIDISTYMSSNNTIIEKIKEDIDRKSCEMVFKTFKYLGFDKQYIIDHIDDFTVIICEDFNCRRFYHKDVYLFTLIN